LGGEKTETGKGVITMAEQCIALFLAVKVKVSVNDKTWSEVKY
jgi:hypothetical protein